LLGQRVNFGDELPLLDLVAQGNMQTLDLARGTRTDTDQSVGIDGTGGQHGVLNIFLFNRGRGHLGNCRNFEKYTANDQSYPNQGARHDGYAPWC